MVGSAGASNLPKPRLLLFEAPYETYQFETCADIETFRRTFNSPNAVLDSVILPEFCSVVVDTCPDDMEQCSRMLSTADDGVECLQWVDRVKGGADATKMNVCRQNPELDECKCLSRYGDEIYEAAVKGLTNYIPDQCWFLECRGTDLAPQLIT